MDGGVETGKKRSRGPAEDENTDGTDKDGLKLPKSTMKRIMKINSEVGAVSLEAVVGTCHATELFLGYLAEQSGKKTHESGRKIMKLEDISAVIDENPNLLFLKDAFGPPVGGSTDTPAPAVDAET